MNREQRLQFLLSLIADNPDINFDAILLATRPVFTVYRNDELDDEVELRIDELLALDYIIERIEEDAITEDEMDVFVDEYIYIITPEGPAFFWIQVVTMLW